MNRKKPQNSQKYECRICFCQNGHRFTNILIQFNDTTTAAYATAISSRSPPQRSNATVNTVKTQDTTLILPTTGLPPAGTNSCFKQHGTDGTGSRVRWHGATAVRKAIGGRCLIRRALPTRTVPTAAHGLTESADEDNREHGSPQTTTSPEGQEHQEAAWIPVHKKCSR